MIRILRMKVVGRGPVDPLARQTPTMASQPMNPRSRVAGAVLASVLVGGLVLASCSSGSEPASRDASPLSASIRAEKVAEVKQPTAFAIRTGDPSTVFYVARQDGVVLRIDGATGTTSTAASFADRTKAGGERGLLGLAFSRDGSEMYAHYTDLDGNTAVVAVPFADGTADVGAARVLLAVEQPYANHNGGQLAVDAGGNLLVGLGDGGSGGDPQGNAQNRTSLLGKVLRITPSPPSASSAYSIPSDNPFVGSSTTAPEIAFLGLRNPWRFSIDPVTGDWWIADVGQNAWEEINRVPAGALGANFGWDVKEGTHSFEGTTTETLTDPIHEWRNVGGSSAIGGYVYRGSALPALSGRYVFADLAQPGVFVLDPADGSVQRLDVPVRMIVAFGVDAAGELYVLSFDSGVYRLVPN